MKHINVAVAVILNQEENKVLLTKRLANKHLAGYWEFPGGKIEENESVEDALVREIKEEIGISIQASSYLQKITHRYDSHTVTLHVYKTKNFIGEINCLEVDSYEWVNINKLDTYQLPPANVKIVKHLQLNSIYVITPEDFTATDLELEKLKNLKGRGIDLLQVRLSSKNQIEIEEVLKKIQSAKLSNKIIINSCSDLVEKYNLAGLHVKSKDLLKLDKLELDEKRIVGASCHNKVEIEKANKLGLDYIFISPIKKTKSYLQDELLGWEKLSELISLAEMPVYALGGICFNDLDQAKMYGARGIAMMREIWNK